MKKINLETHGVEHTFQRKDVKEKTKQTIIKKYGVENASQNENIFHKQQVSSCLLKLHEQTGLYYRGTYEKHFLDFCLENNIPVTKGKTIKYLFEGKIKTYFSDFYLEEKNLIIEIKSDYTYKKDLDKNLAKEKSCIEQEYNFLFIINKKYEGFKNVLASAFN